MLKIFYIFIVLFPFFLKGQQFPSFYFTNLSEANNNVNSITQDNDGLIWIGTENGLNRYDGLQLKTYYKNDPLFKLAFSYVLDLRFAQGKLWITGLNHCDIFDLKANKKTAHFNYKLTAQLNFLQRDTFLTAFSDLYKFSQKNKFSDISFKPVRKYFRFIEYDTKTILGYFQNRIDFLNQGDLVRKDSVILPLDYEVTDALRDSVGNIWFGTWSHGLHIMDGKTKKVSPFDLGKENFNATKLYRWQNEGRWYIIASINDKYGLVIIDEKSRKYKYLHEICNSKFDIPLAVNCMFVDNLKNLWLGTNQGVKLFSVQNLFKIHKVVNPSRIEPNKSQSSMIKFIDDEIYVFKRYSDGLFILDKNWQLKKHIPILYHGNGNNANGCKAIDGFDLYKVNDEVFISTNCGLVKMNIETHASTLYSPQKDGGPELRAIVPIDKNQCLIRARNSRIYRFDVLSKNFTKEYFIKDEKGTNLEVNHLELSNDGTSIFAVSDNILFKFNPAIDAFENQSRHSLKGIRMASFIQDKKGIIWISTYTGLYSYDLKSNKILNSFEGYEDMSYVLRSCLDKNDNVWFNCQRGFWCWLQKEQRMIRFGYNLGLPDNRITAGITASPDKSKIYAGAEDAVVEFDPDAISNYQLKSKTIITDLSINDESQHFFNFSGNQKSVTLGTSQRNIVINYAVADFSLQGNFEYYYRINNEAWLKTSSGNVSFNRLQHGTFLFEVKGKLAINGIEAKSDILKIIVLPFWYETNIFKLILLLTTGFGLYYLYLRRIKKVRRENEIKSTYDRKMITLELSNLRSQMNPHFIFNSLNSINGFIVENETRLASDYLTKFSRLVRMILENSKNEYISLEKEIETLQLYLLIEGLRFDNKFSYAIKVDDAIDAAMVKVPPMIIQPFVENAIWHGLLPQKSGKVSITIAKIPMRDQLKVVIEDNGIGREKAVALKTKSGLNNKSFGIDITTQRLKTLNADNNVIITDLMENNENCGTRIEINLEMIKKSRTE
jgi:ligand-binding sensor domain-containing protein